ncbi:MAG TPA: MMPL family transporter [Solirubrobacteraceae bacterium]|nr:MMPL family transporter [Solirubrobacteraceae bacterium]
MLSRLLGRLMALGARRPVVVAATVLVLAATGAVLALRMQPSADTGTLVGRSTTGYAATQVLHRRFGDDAIYVLIGEPVSRVVLTSDLDQVLGLEGCLSGNVPAAQTPPGGPAGPCARLAATKPAKVVFGPGTFLNEAVGQISDEFTAAQAAERAQARRAGDAAYRLALAHGLGRASASAYAQQAAKLVQAKFTAQVLGLALRYGLTAAPSLDDPQFISRLVFDDRRPAGTPKARFASIFPGPQGALIQVRLRDGLSESAQRAAIADIRAATRMPDWRLSAGGYAVTGAPVLVQELSSAISHSILVLLLAAVVVMALTLLLVFRARLRLVPLLVALAAAGLTFGVMAISGVGLTMASIAVIPVLIGLAVDYAVQLQSRIQEEPVRLEPSLARVAARGAPTIAIAAAATAAGFLVLALSPVPMVRGFGVLLVVGIILAIVCALTLGVAVQALAERRGARPAKAGDVGALGRARVALEAAWNGAGEIVTGSHAWELARGGVHRGGRGALRAAVGRPGRVLGIAAALALAGWALDTQTRVESDVQKLVPQNLAALSDLHRLQNISGVGGEVDVVVEGRRVTDPAVVAWMTRYQAKILRELHYDPRRGCGRSDVCPAFSLPDLFTTKASLATRARVENLLDAVPSYFSQSVITPDRRTATLAFGLRLMPLERQFQVLRTMRAGLDPPPGVRARLAGLPVLAAEANDRLSSPLRRIETLVAGLLAVGLVLLLALRSPRRALVPLIPIVLATGWSALVLFLTRIPLNPLSIVLGALVIAIATEFSVLLSERFRAERAAGHEVTEALQRTYRSTGAAVLASGVTAIAGFAVLVVSDIRMLRDFGFVTVIDLAVALIGVLVVLPAVLVLAERGALVPRPVRARRRGAARVERAPAA